MVQLRNTLLFLLFITSGQAIAQAQYSRVVFFKGYMPFGSDIYTHKVKITPDKEGQYARPKTKYTGKYILVGRIRARSVMVYDYLQPTPAFYIGHDTRDLITPTDSVQFINVKNRFSFFTPRYSFRKVSAGDFKKLYARKKWLRKKLKQMGYSSFDDMMKVSAPEPQEQ